MGRSLKLAAADGVALKDLPANLVADPWQNAPANKRQTAELRMALIQDCLEPRNVGAKTMAENLLSKIQAGTASTRVACAATALGGKLSVPTLKRWIDAARKGGKNALLPAHTGRVRKDKGWEVRCLHLWDLPSKPGYSDVAWKLRSEGWSDVTDYQVRRYLSSLPRHLAGQHSINRVGVGLYGQTRVNYQRRSTDCLLVGEIYAGDGHTVDCYVAHPSNGTGLFRPELTVFLDIRSRYVVGWWFSESETKESTLFALSHALISHDHVPGWLYLDHGAGYRAQMLSDVETGWFKKFEIETIAAIPGNPKGKGWIERFFRTVRDKHDKLFAEGKVYCGDDMAHETNRRLHIEVKQGLRQLPSYQAYVESFASWVSEYHNTPMDVLDGKTPTEVWSGLKRVNVHVDHDAVMRPSIARMVRRQSVTLDKRTYFNEALVAYDGLTLPVEYDLHNDKLVWVRDQRGRLICEAELAGTIGVLPPSRLDEQRIKREQGQLQRLENKAHEVRVRSQPVLTVDSQVADLEALGYSEPQPLVMPAKRYAEALPLVQEIPNVSPKNSDADGDLDILTWRDE
jgi:putative transposase